MPTQHVDEWVDPVVEGPALLRPSRLSVIVGFDGSESAYRALDAAAQLISGRTGRMVAVFVAHVPAAAELSAVGLLEVRNSFDALEQEFTEAIGRRLGPVEHRWRLERREGNVAHELVLAADEVSHDYGADATVVIVVGSAVHTYHHVVGSVPVSLVRHATYPILVVP